jgi:hypothetical protein
MERLFKLVSGALLLAVLGVMVCTTPDRAEAQPSKPYLVFKRDVPVSGSPGPWQSHMAFATEPQARQEATYMHDSEIPPSGGHWQCRVIFQGRILYDTN